jgi:thiamine-monophosphate kinase
MPASEFDLIAAITERLPTPNERVRLASGDDAAVVEPAGASAVSVDAIVEDVHFRTEDFGGRGIGRKALAAALSDLAAMGAMPGEAYVVVAAPPDLPDDRLLQIADGLAEVASREGVTVAGGDLVTSQVLMVSVTVVGYEPDGGHLISRIGARPGDVVAVTGALGGAAAALMRMGETKLTTPLTDEQQGILLDHQLDPVPRLREGRALAAAGATAMIDVSDGLGADSAHLAESSGVRLEIDAESIPIANCVIEVAGSEGAALELAASGGEDFELLVTLPSDRVDEARDGVSEAGTPLTEIGQVVEGQGVALKLPGGGEIEPRGFDQRRGSLSGSG